MEISYDGKDNKIVVVNTDRCGNSKDRANISKSK